ncbi:hypothetical protein ACFE04_009937 [Oxalis oulophora]
MAGLEESFMMVFVECLVLRILKLKRKEEAILRKDEEMTIKQAIRVVDKKLIVRDRTILTGVPDNVIVTSGPVEGVFLGVEMDRDDSRHVVCLGTFRDVRFMACFRFKLWWMAQKMGDKGKDIPLETQFLLTETKDGSHLESDRGGIGNEQNRIVYTVFLPLIDGSFRACLQGNERDKLELCLESGDVETKTSSFRHSVFVHSGTDPFTTIQEAVKAVKSHLNSFRHRQDKKLPGILDYFGWCTWDAFYQEVTQEGVEAGIESLAAGGAPAKFVIIDDGWQSVAGDLQTDEEKPLPRLTGIKENSKFQEKDNPNLGIKHIVDIAKRKNFPDNGIIACMSHNTDALYWAISGGPLYVSDAPGKHNFELLKKLVLPDGSILRARLPGRPTGDCLFSDPARDGVSLLKIWNMNKYTGVLGIYNCQGAAWSSSERKNAFHPTTADAITASVRGRDVHLISEASINSDQWSGDCAFYCHNTRQLFTLPYNASLPISLKVLEYQIFTITPIKTLAGGFSFAPIGLIDMFNSGGAIEELKYDEKVGKVCMEVRGCGKFGVYSSDKPRRCVVGSIEVGFEYEELSGLVSVSLDCMPEEGRRHVVEFEL